MRACTIIGVFASIAGSIRVMKKEDADEMEIGDVFEEAAELMETEANQTMDQSPSSRFAKDVFDVIQRVRAAGYRCPDGQYYAPNSRRQTFDCRLGDAARLHSRDMANNNYFSHTSRDGRSPSTRARDAGFPGGCGEIIAAGGTTAEAAVRQWQNSQSGHCNALMNPNNKVVGFGYAYNGNAQYRHYWTGKLHGGSVTPVELARPIMSVLG